MTTVGAKRKLGAIPAPAPSTIAAAADHLAYQAELEDWAEREARGDGPWLVDQLARDLEDRKHPPAPGGGDTAAPDPWDAPERTPNDDAAPVVPPRLPSMSEVISTARRYVLAATRVDEAFGLLETQLRDEATGGAWSASAMRRGLALLARADATGSRRLKVRRCVVGDLQVPTFVCACCGQVKLGVPMTCNSRACPRCVGKLRRANQKKVHALLELVDQRRQQQHQRAARWRFATLTLPSMPAFGPMRRRIGEAWGQLLRTRIWQTVGASIAAFETTHTARGWHVHLHAIVDQFLPRIQLAQSWARIVYRLAVRDAREGPPIPWLARNGERATSPLSSHAAAAAATLQSMQRAAPMTWGAARAMADRDQAFAARFALALERGTAHADGDALELRHLARDAVRLVSTLATRQERTVARWQLRSIVRQVPWVAAQHVRGTAGTRAQIVHELAKYAAKDLGAAGAANGGEWGVAGTPQRLAEFMRHSFRWRTLRAYGDAFDAQLREDQAPIACDDCGTACTFDRTLIYTAAEWRSIEAQRRRDRVRRRKRDGPAPDLVFDSDTTLALRSVPAAPPPKAQVRILPPPAAEIAAVVVDAMRARLSWWRDVVGPVAFSAP